MLTLPYQKEFEKPQEDIIPDRLKVVNLGRIDYLSGYAYQRKVVDGIIKNFFPDTLILCQHPHTFTTGRLGKETNLLINRNYLRKRKIDFFVINRGGDITYHGPGQLVIYPIFDLNKHKKDLKFFLSNLEQVIIDFLEEFEIIAKRKPGYTGVWVNNKKIASIGISVRKWISFHGLAINLNTDLEFFSMIKPCGLEIEMTTMEREIGKKINFALAKKIILQKFIAVFYQNKNILSQHLKQEVDING